MSNPEIDIYERAAAAGKFSWGEVYVDLAVRSYFLGETNPKPFVDIPSYSRLLKRTADALSEKGKIIEVDAEVLACNGLTIYAQDWAYKKSLRLLAERGKIVDQQQRLRGRNRFATTEQRTYVWLRDKSRCRYCTTVVMPGQRRSVSSISRMEMDHVVAWWDGGSTVVKNIVCSCMFCNVLKGRKTAEEFIEYRGSTTFSEMMDDYQEAFF